MRLVFEPSLHLPWNSKDGEKVELLGKKSQAVGKGRQRSRHAEPKGLLRWWSDCEMCSCCSCYEFLIHRWSDICRFSSLSVPGRKEKQRLELREVRGVSGKEGAAWWTFPYATCSDKSTAQHCRVEMACIFLFTGYVFFENVMP